MATGRLPDPNTAPVTAKGDLYTYSTVPAKLAVGNNGDTLVADSSASTGLRYNPTQAAGKNAIINGGMDIWQRGTSLAVAGGAFNPIADRWGTGRAAAAGGYTISRQATGDTTNLPFIQYCMRIARNNGDTVTGGIQTVQNIETINSIPFAGRTVTISAYIRKGADYSGTNMTLNLNSGTGTDQNLNQSYTGNTTVCTTTITPTTTWVRYSVTGTVSSTATELALWIYQNAAGTASTANDYIEITGVQLELGSVATAFTRTGGTIAGELDACKRYAQNINYSLSGKNVYNTVANGSATGATSSRITLYLPVPMRVAPTSVTFTASGFVLDNVASAPTVTGVTINQGGTDTVLLTVDASAGALTNKDPVIMYANNNSSANLILSAEL